MDKSASSQSELLDNNIEIKKLEYQMAQDMLKHYDSLNWKIGSILIAGVLMFDGIMFKALTENAEQYVFITLSTTAMSAPLLIIWYLWFRRHRFLYNLRNETMHRLELELGMYHHLRVLSSYKGIGEEKQKKLKEIEKKVGYESTFKPFFDLSEVPGPSGYDLALGLVYIILTIQMLCFSLYGYIQSL